MFEHVFAPIKIREMELSCLQWEQGWQMQMDL